MAHETRNADGRVVVSLVALTFTLSAFAKAAAGSAPLRTTDPLSQGGLWPGRQWPKVEPDAVGLSASKVDAYLAWLTARAGGEPFGTVVVRHGRIAVEHYGSGGTPASTWEIGSIRKAVGSALLGRAIEEGKLTLQTPAYRVWPPIVDPGSQEKDEAIQVRHLFCKHLRLEAARAPGHEMGLQQRGVHGRPGGPGPGVPAAGRPNRAAGSECNRGSDRGLKLALLSLSRGHLFPRGQRQGGPPQRLGDRPFPRSGRGGRHARQEVRYHARLHVRTGPPHE